MIRSAGRVTRTLLILRGGVWYERNCQPPVHEQFFSHNPQWWQPSEFPGRGKKVRRAPRCAGSLQSCAATNRNCEYQNIRKKEKDWEDGDDGDEVFLVNIKARAVWSES